MVKARSLDHTRFVITTTGVSKQARTLYYAGGSSKYTGAKVGDWATDLGGAKVYNDINVARKKMETMRDHYNSIFTTLGPGITFKVELVQKKDVMIARLKYNPEDING